ncbi:hypothetical protein MJT46_017054 [Ovis ammon polii x Ovis aries]|nr:hypothetical protein MJT46_017054 [Ovis ammon polii x Ovis aries]
MVPHCGFDLFALIMNDVEHLFMCLLAIYKLSIGVWIYLWAFYFVPLNYISVFVPVPYCLDDCGFVVEPKVRSLLNLSCIFSILVSRLFMCNYILFSRFGSFSLSLFRILYQDLDLSLTPLVFSLILTVALRILHLYSTDDKTSRLKMKSFSTVRDTQRGSQSYMEKRREYIMRKAGLEETQAGIKIAGRNINNLRYADDTTLTAESEEELKSLLMKEESEKVGLKLNIQKTKIMAFGPIT